MNGRAGAAEGADVPASAADASRNATGIERKRLVMGSPSNENDTALTHDSRGAIESPKTRRGGSQDHETRDSLDPDSRRRRGPVGVSPGPRKSQEAGGQARAPRREGDDGGLEEVVDSRRDAQEARRHGRNLRLLGPGVDGPVEGARG